MRARLVKFTANGGESYVAWEKALNVSGKEPFNKT